jgi:phospho-N-acetylmuramoyl-pentapeptide-transferase
MTPMLIRLAEAFLAALIIVWLAGPALIRWLRSLSLEQTVYELAPPSHGKKTGTPTMGGLLFVVAPLIALLTAPDRRILALLVLVVACMAIGAIDDLASIRKQKNRGLRAVPKFALTALATIVFLLVAGPQATTLLGIGVVPAWIWYVLSVCVVLATTHAVNLTDGLDGLASGTIVPPLVVLAVLAWRLHLGDLAVFDVATLGAVGGFLVYNRYPARVFMGDTGSLALGGALAGAAILCGAHLLLLLIGGVFAAETLSVIVQVASYKTTRRRIFRMSPLHHHFEQLAWPETRITPTFWLTSLILSLLGFALIARTA